MTAGIVPGPVPRVRLGPSLGRISLAIAILLGMEGAIGAEKRRTAAQAEQAIEPGHYTLMWNGARVGTFEVASTSATTREYIHRPLAWFGPETTSAVTVGREWVPTQIDIRSAAPGVNQIEERFRVERSTATWTNRAERGEGPFDGRTFYMSVDGSEWLDLLPRALLAAREHRLPVLPDGEARLQREGERQISRGNQSRTVAQYRMTGIGLTPLAVWLDLDGSLFASEARGVLVIRRGWEDAFQELQSWARHMSATHWAAVARQLGRRPTAPFAVRNVRVFDPERKVLTAQTTVVIRGNRITAVGPDGVTHIPELAEVLDAEGKTLLPGLWDMHGHSGGVDGILNIAAGVTGVRNPAGDPTVILEDSDRWNNNIEIGPRVVWAGVVDAIGPATPPMGPELAWMFPETEDGARAAVRRHAQLGAAQIKIYNSLRPELVPVVIEEAHRAGLWVGSHVPRGMTAEAAVRQGLDEIHHLGAVFGNFRRDPGETLAEIALRLDLGSPAVREFIELLRSRRVIVDPTVNVQEARLTSAPGTLMSGWQAIADRLPPLERRVLRIQGNDGAEEVRRRNRDAFVAMLAMVKTLHDAGVQIVAGTDTDPTGLPEGFALYRELELYVQAGIAPADVLSLATLGAARAVRRSTELGSIAPGKLADLVLVDGDPVRRIEDIRRVVLVVKNGVVYDSAALYRTLGIRPCCGP